jgi:DNA polymerase III sliding clamp (beta) subunit (PCNA family)
MKKQDILDALTIVKPGLSNKEIIEQASSFAFIDGNIVTYNDEISIQHPVEGLDFTGAIKAEILYGLLSKVKSEEIEMTVNGNELSVVAGRTKAGITFQEEVKLPLDEINEKTKWKKLPADFSKYLQMSAGACSGDMSTPVLTCVHVVKEGYFMSSDNYKILQAKLTGPMPVESFLIPANSAIIVAKMNPNKISIGPGWVHFMTEARTIISCRIFENDKYPDIVKVLETKGTTISFPVSLAKTLERTGIFAKREHIFDEVVELTIQNKKLIVKASCDQGWIEESLNMAYEGEPIKLFITPYLLKDILSRTSECVIGKNKLKFQSEDWIYVSALKNL